MYIRLWDDGYVTNEVSTVKTCESNLNEENRIKFVTDLAAVSRGKSESNNPSIRYRQLLEEAAMKTPSRPLEFLPIIIKGRLIQFNIVELEGKDTLIKYSLPSFMSLIARFSYIDYKENNVIYIYTNMRCLINAGIPYDNIPYIKDELKEEYKKFKAAKANIPMFVWAQVPMTHTQISKESQSDRVAENTKYWMPMDYEERARELLEEMSRTNKKIDYDNDLYPELLLSDTIGEIDDLEQQKKDGTVYNTPEIRRKVFLNDLMVSYSQEEIYDLFKKLGYRREIWSRAVYYFKYKEVVMTAWHNDCLTWDHLFRERSAKPEEWKNWTQSTTKEFVIALKEVIESED